MLDIDSLLQAVNDATPCGEDLEFDPLFAEMERAKRGTDAQQIGDSINEGEPPNWRLVTKNAVKLLKQSHDVRIATTLSMAMLHLHSFAGFAQGLQLLTGLLKNDWQCLHPEHDPYDDYPIERVNALSELGHHSFVLTLKKHPLVAARGLGQFSFDDIQFALKKGDKAQEDDRADTTLINATFKACELDTLQQTSQSVTDIVHSFQQMNKILQDAIGVQYAPNFSKTVQLLTEINKTLQSHLPEPPEAEPESIDNVEVVDNTDILAASHPMNTVKVRAVTTIENREDVNRALNKICQYYDKYEPSSPVPLILKRAQGLVDKSFVEVMQDLSPNSVNELLQLFGTSDDK